MSTAADFQLVVLAEAPTTVCEPFIENCNHNFVANRG